MPRYFSFVFLLTILVLPSLILKGGETISAATINSLNPFSISSSSSRTVKPSEIPVKLANSKIEKNSVAGNNPQVLPDSLSSSTQVQHEQLYEAYSMLHSLAQVMLECMYDLSYVLIRLCY